VNDCQICCCDYHSFHLHLEGIAAGAGSSAAVAVVVTAATATAEEAVRMGADYLLILVHLNLLLSCEY
jgi:mevalonate kinase